jgi:hypothetical protein
VQRNTLSTFKFEINACEHCQDFCLDPGTSRSSETKPMRNELSDGGVRPSDVSALTEPGDPDCRVHAAWLAQVSNAGDGLLAKDAGGSTTVSTSSSAPADRLAGEVHLAPAHVDRRSGLIAKVFIGGIFAAGVAAIIAIPPYFFFFETSQQPNGDPIELTSPDSMKPVSRPMQNGSERPKLLAEPTLGAPGEPVPMGLTLQGRANDVVVILRGLVPGMELSAGSAVTGGTWQLSATDLPYAWIAPPKDFVGSTDLIAELRLSNDQIADRQTIHLQWMTPSSPTPAQSESDRNEITAAPPISPEIAHPKDREAMAPSKERTQRQLNAKEIKRPLKREKADSRVARPDAGRRAPITGAYAGDGRNPPKGFWDWSR